MTSGDRTSQGGAAPEPAFPVPVPEGDEPDQERPVVAEAERTRQSPDPEAPEADALDQAREVAPEERPVGTPVAREADEADVWEQSIEVPLDDDRRP